MLSFIELFPPNVCAPDPNVCRPCVTAENSAGVEHGAPALDDPATCVDGRRCLRAGEVPFWWYNGVAPGPLFRVPTDSEVAERTLGDAGRGRTRPSFAPGRRSSARRTSCPPTARAARRRTTSSECKRAITSTHHHGAHVACPASTAGRTTSPSRAQRKDYVLRQRGHGPPRTNWYHGARGRSRRRLPPRPAYCIFLNFVSDLKLPSLSRSRALVSLPPRRPRRSRDSQHRIQRRQRSVRDVPHLRSRPSSRTARTANAFSRAGSTASCDVFADGRRQRARREPRRPTASSSR